MTTEFTLHAIRDRRTAWMVARQDARLRAQVARALSECVRGAGLTPTVDPEELARLLIAVREGELAQSYVEPDQLAPGELGHRYLAPLLSAVTYPRPKGPWRENPDPLKVPQARTRSAPFLCRLHVGAGTRGVVESAPGAGASRGVRVIRWGCAVRGGAGSGPGRPGDVPPCERRLVERHAAG